MSAWRREAIERLPGLKKAIEEAQNPYKGRKGTRIDMVVTTASARLRLVSLASPRGARQIP